jgi:hypothetical protein
MLKYASSEQELDFYRERKTMTNSEFPIKKPEMILATEIYLQANEDGQKMVVLKENKESDQFFMMFVGESEFMAIAKEKGLFDSPRPMTHEIYLRIFRDAPIRFIKVEIHSMKEGTYFANICYEENGQEVFVDARPSDSVALALHNNIPIYVNKELLRPVLTERDIEDFRDIIKTVKF